jgi:CRISPR/Cas system-associated exonuclease Cas4 (RecB family)
MNIIQVGDLKGNEEFLKIKEELETLSLDVDGYKVKLFKIDYLAKNKLKGKQILLFESEEDYQLHKLLERRKNFFEYESFEDITFEDLDINVHLKGNSQPNIYLFPNKYVQFFYLFSSIRKKLCLDESYKERLIIYCDPNDLYYINIFSKIFKIPVKSVLSRPIISIVDIKNVVQSIYDQKSFNIEYDLNNIYVKNIKELIDIYKLADISKDSFDIAYANLLEIISNFNSDILIDNKGVSLTNHLTFDNNSYIYVTNYQFDEFYKEFDDDNLVSDDELLAIGVNTSYHKTKMDRRKKLNYIRFNKFGFVSRVVQHLTDALYDSQFNNEFKWDQVDKDLDESLIDEGLLTDEAKDMIEAYFKDNAHYIPDRKKHPDDIYRSYNHDFSGISPEKLKVEKFSVTGVEEFSSCPFKYYLNTVLGLDKQDPYDDKFYRKLGNVLHATFENVYEGKGDEFEERFKLGIEAYKKDCQEYGEGFTAKDEVFLEIVKYWARLLYLDILKQPIKPIEHPNIEKTYENKVEYSITGKHDDTYNLTGYIDKMVYTSYNDKKYYTIIDYKSGVEAFNYKEVFLGQSLQLPMYYYAVENFATNLKNDCVFGGMGISKIYQNNPKKFSVDKNTNEVSLENVAKSFATRGIITYDDDYIHSFDNSAFDEEGKLNARATSSKYLYRGLRIIDANDRGEDNKGFKGKYSLNELIEDAKKIIIEVITKIKNNQFDVKPATFSKSSNDNVPCKFCSFKDICYRNLKKDLVNNKSKINEKFGADGVEDNDDEE